MKMHRAFVSLIVPAALFAAFVGCSAAQSNSGSGGDDFASSSSGIAQSTGNPSSTSATFMSTTGSMSSTGTGGGFVGDPTTCDQAASSRTYVGCDFWPTVSANSVWSIFDFAVVVANAGTAQADITVTRGGQNVASASVAPNALAKVYLPWVPELKGSDWDTCTDPIPLSASVTAPGGAYHLTATSPVTVYQFSALEYGPQGGPPGKNWGNCPGDQDCQFFGGPAGCFSYSNDASILIPSTAMTGNYRLISVKGNGQSGSSVTVTGTQDGTNVTVTASGTAQIIGGGGINGAGPNGTTTFTLNTGDVVELAGGANNDLGGSLVQADKPIQVMSGHPCLALPTDNQDATCDHVEETVFPAETLGKHYVVSAPSGPHGAPAPYILRIYGNVDGTNLSYPSGQPSGAPLTINAGQVVDLGQVQGNFEIQGDHEFLVSTTQMSAIIVDPQNQLDGDPALSQATAVEQYRTKYIFLAPTDYDVNFVDIVQPLSAQITIDGQPAAGSPTAVGSTFGVTRIQLAAGNGGAHVLTATEPVGIQVLGYGQYTSYQYPGGSNFVSIAPPPPPPK